MTKKELLNKMLAEKLELHRYLQGKEENKVESKK